MKTGIGLLGVALAIVATASAATPPAYRLAATVPLGAPDRWDYVVFDAGTQRVYVAHGDRVAVVDPVARTVVGTIAPIPGGTHGIAISNATGEGYTDDGRAGTVIAFDLKTLAIGKTIPADQDADAIARDPESGDIYVIEGDPAAVTIIDPKTDAVVGTVKVGEKLEYGAGDDHGSIYVAGEEKGDLVRIDTRTRTVRAHYPAAGCVSPHGLAIDKVGRRVFLGCANGVMPVLDADDGHVVAVLPIGRGNDAVAYDSVRRRVFSANGLDGTISIYQQDRRGHFAAVPTLAARVSGRTMSVDPASGRLFVAAAQTDPAPTPNGRPKPRPGTLDLLIFDPER